MQDPNSLRIVLVGKHGSGMSSLANCILGEAVFGVTHGSDATIRRSETHTAVLNGRSVTVIDTPGILGGVRSDLVRRCEWMSRWAQCAPGPHAVLLVMPVQRFTQQERAVVEHIKAQFGDEMFRFTTVVFTHGDQLPENMRISEFVEQSAELAELVQACGGRCHVVDHKYWTSETKEGDPQRSNAFQVNAILASVERTARDNQMYSNDALEQVEREIQTEQRRLHNQAALGSEESREQAKRAILDKYIDEAARRPPYLKYAAVLAGIASVAVFVVPKVIKLLAEKPLLPVLDVVPNVVEYAQGAAQEVVQGVAQEAVQGVAQEAVQGVVQEAVQGVVQGVAQEAVQGVVQEVAQEAVQGVVQGVAQEVVQGVVQEAVQGVAQEVAQEVVQEAVQEVVQGVVQEAVQEVVQGVVQEAVEGVVEESILTLPEVLFEKYDPFNLFT